MKLGFIILTCTMLFLTSCLLIGGENGNTDDELEREIYKGTLGARIDIFANKLPKSVFENEDVNYVVKIENKGPYPVNNARFLVSLEKGFMEFKTGGHIFLKSDISLEGKTIYNIFDDFLIEEIPIRSKNLDPLSEVHDTVIQSSFCYDYQGRAFADVCIDTDPHGIKSVDKACETRDSIALSEGQGGPVVITSIEPRMLVDNGFIRPQFIIHIRNQGQGTVIRSGSVSQVCNSNGLSGNTYNAITVTGISFSNFNKGSFDCSPPELVLRREQDSIVCTLKSGLISQSTAAFKTPLRVDIAYGYIESLSKDIKINKIKTY